VLEYLKLYGSISSLEAANSLHIVDVVSVIRDLIDCGISIKKEWKTNGKTRYKRYYLIIEDSSEKVAA
jgi:hypothetical protein